MIIDQFKLDHLVEKNNECAIYRATNNDDHKFMVLQINREPLIRMNHYKTHFQSELTFLFTNTPKPNKVPHDFPFNLPDQIHQHTDISFPLIMEIHQTDHHYYLVLSNCLQGTFQCQQPNIPQAFLQAFTLYDIYFDAFQSKQITDRDFSIRRLFWSNTNLTLIDFGFSLFQKAHKPLSWSVKLGNLYNQIAGPNQNPKVRRVIQLLLSNKIQWTLIKDNLNQAFDYISKQLVPQDPMEICITDQPIKLTQSKGFQRSINAPSLTQTRVIKQGNLNLRDHFEKIKKSLSPGLSNRMPQILRPILESQRQSPNSTYSRRSAMQNRQFLLNKPIENQFEYTIPNRSQSRELDQSQYNNTHTQQSRSQPNQGRGQKSYTQYDGAQQNSVQIVENSSYMPTIMEKQPIVAQRRPQTSQPVKNEETPERHNRMKTLLRTSTRELQQSDAQGGNQQNFGRGTSEDTPVVKKQTDAITLTLKKPPSRRNSVDRGSARSIQNIELQSNNSPNVKEYTNKLKMPKQQHTQGYQSDEIDDLDQYSNKNKTKITMQQINQQIQQHNYQITSLDVQEVSYKKPVIVEQDMSEIKLISHKQDSQQRKAIQIQNVNVQAFKIDQIEDKQKEVLYHVQMEYQIKKYDIIGRMVAIFINHFQAKKNFWIIPLFLCFKRMAAFRLQLYDAIANEDYFLDIDLNVARKQELVRDFLVRVGQENKIVKKELGTLFQICEQTWKKFNQDEFAKIEKYMNMDMQQDIKDIYFVYLYTQIYKTVQSQYTKITDEQKQKDNLKLQANALVSLIISEMPFNNNEDDTFSFTELQSVGEHNLQEMQQYVKKLEVKVVQLKSRLNQKGIKI